MSNLFGIPRRARRESRDIDAQARAWLIELDDEPASQERLALFRDWLTSDPLHRRAFEQVAVLWRDMDFLGKVLDGRLPSAAGAGSGARAGAAPRQTGEPAQSAQPRQPPQPQSPATSARPGWFAGAWLKTASVAIAAVVLVSFILYLSRPGAERVASQTYQTATGEVRAFALSDGSTIRLNTGSKVVVSYGNRARILQLTAGEAFFEVAPNPQRPFIVYAGRFSVRALGTAFAVQMLDSGVDLTVTKGHVEFASFKQAPTDFAVANSAGLAPDRSDPAEARVPLFSGQHATVARDVRLIEQIDAKGIEKRLSWRDGMLIFDDDPLTEVVSEISRYTPKRIVISDPSIRDLKVGGYFKVQDIGSILAALQESFGIEVREDNDHAIYLSRGRRAQ